MKCQNQHTFCSAVNWQKYLQLKADSEARIAINEHSMPNWIYVVVSILDQFESQKRGNSDHIHSPQCISVKDIIPSSSVN